jgi:hypothetical protein
MMNKLNNLMVATATMQKEVAKACEIDCGMFSKFVNQRCLPIREEREKIADFFGVSQLDIWDRADFSLGLPTRKIEVTGYKFTARLDSEDREDIEYLMKELGTTTCKDFMKALIRNQKKTMGV